MMTATNSAGSRLTQAERFKKNSLEDRRKQISVADNDIKGNAEITYSHDRNHNVQNFYCGVFSGGQ